MCDNQYNGTRCSKSHQVSPYLNNLLKQVLHYGTELLFLEKRLQTKLLFSTHFILDTQTHIPTPPQPSKIIYIVLKFPDALTIIYQKIGGYKLLGRQPEFYEEGNVACDVILSAIV